MQPTKVTRTKPSRMIIYGAHKIGKSTFASGCPSPIFIQTEDGLENIKGEVNAFPLCKSFDDFSTCITWLLNQKHEYKTLVIDSIDWLETIIWKEICEKNNWKNLADGGYGIGYKYALGYWQRIISGLDKLNREKQMMICLLAHSKIMKYEDPEAQNYDRHTLDLHDKASELLCEYVDLIGFAFQHIAVIENKEGFGTSIKAKSTGKRLLATHKAPGHEGGNRYSIENTCSLDWPTLNSLIQQSFGGKKDGDVSVK